MSVGAPHLELFLISRFCTMSIVKIHAREIFDSRGNPTVEVDLYTDKGGPERGSNNTLMKSPEEYLILYIFICLYTSSQHLAICVM